MDQNTDIEYKDKTVCDDNTPDITASEKQERKKQLAKERYKRYCEKNPTAAAERQKKYMKNLRIGYKKLLDFYENMKQNVGEVNLDHT